MSKPRFFRRDQVAQRSVASASASVATSPMPRTYRAGSLRDALSLVRRDLGGDAVILGTREVRARRWFGLGDRELIEVTASESPAIAIAPPAPDSTTALTLAHQQLHEKFGEQLSRLHSMVEDLSRQGRLEHMLPDLPGPLVPIYSTLLETDVPEPLARRLTRHVADQIEPAEYHKPDVLRDALREAVALCLPIAPPITAIPGTRRVVALVGPTGVGKTTTVAKLAANFKLVHGLRPGLLTVDTYRIAAVEQLRTYAEIIDLPLEVVSSMDQMRPALDRLGDQDLILIDTAGRSPRDELKIRELADFLEQAQPDEIHLVLSAVAGERSLRAAVDRFSVARPDRLILTKLDEADGLGVLLGLLSHADRPISYLTTGQSVPEDIEPADPVRLASLILGHELLA